MPKKGRTFFVLPLFTNVCDKFIYAVFTNMFYQLF